MDKSYVDHSDFRNDGGKERLSAATVHGAIPVADRVVFTMNY